MAMIKYSVQLVLTVTCTTCMCATGTAGINPACYEADELLYDEPGTLIPAAMDNTGRITGTLDSSADRMAIYADGVITTIVTMFPQSEGQLLNDVGQAAGLGSTGVGQHDRLIRVNADSSVQLLAVITGSGGWSTLQGMNNAGSIAGNYSGGSGSSDWQAFLWTDEDGLIFIEPSSDTTYLRAIDGTNRVAGQMQVGGSYHAMLWDDGVLTDLHDELKLTGGSAAWAFDLDGRVLISALYTYFWYDSSDGSTETVHTFPSGSTLLRNRVADNGTVGFSWIHGGIPHGGRWTTDGGFESIVIDKPAISFDINDINDAGHMTASSFTLPVYERAALLWGDGTQVIELESFLEYDPINSNAHFLNNAGQVLMSGNEYWILSTRCEGDVDGDGAVDVNDLLLVISSWGGDGGGDCGPDTDGSGVVDVNDLLDVIAAWGSCG
jgi:hypothetical protein